MAGSGGRVGPPAPPAPEPKWGPGVGWLTAVALAAALAINLVGLGAIAVAQRGVAEEAQRLLRLETEARAGALESTLASMRADLAFLTGSPIFFGLESALLSHDPREARWRRLEAEGALLLFLRGHPEAAHLAARSGDGVVLVAAGRRGGIPVLWKPGDVPGRVSAGQPGDSTAGPGGEAGRAITGRFEFVTGVRKVSGAVTLEATLDAGRLLALNRAVEDPSRACILLDRDGATLASDPGGAALMMTGAGAGDEEKVNGMHAGAEVRTESWSAPSPWRLACSQRRGPAVALVQPLAARYRLTLILNLAVMSLALLLGAFTIQQARRQQSLEARAREEARVRDLERQLFHTERLGTVGRLAAGMAHEINNPLAAILQSLQNVQRRLNPDQPGNQAAAKALGVDMRQLHNYLEARDINRFLSGMESAGHRAAEIVRHMLEFSRSSSRQLEPTGLNAIAHASVDFIHNAIELSMPALHARLIIEEDYDPGLPAIPASGVELQQVLVNLLKNAAQAIQEARREMPLIRVSTRLVPPFAEVRVEDNGIGMNISTSRQIFDPFFTTKAVGQGTGLGLSISHFIISQRHHGRIEVSSTPGVGTTFILSIPLQQASYTASA